MSTKKSSVKSKAKATVSGKSASAKSPNAKAAIAKSKSAKDVSAKDVSAKSVSAKSASAKSVSVQQKAKTAPAKPKSIAKPAKPPAKPAAKPAAAKKVQGKPVPVKKASDKKPASAPKAPVTAAPVVKAKAQPVPSKAVASKKPAAAPAKAADAAPAKSNGQSSPAPKKAEPLKASAVKAAEPAKTEAPKTEAAHTQIVKAEPAKAQASKPEPSKPEPAKKSSRPEAPPRPSPRVISMASSPVRPPVVAVPGQPAILVKAGPSTPQLSGPRPSAAGDAAKLATLIKASGFATGDHVVYPTHGVGQIVETETQSIGGMDLHLFVITFEKDRMTLRLPIAKVRNSGLRRLATKKEMLTALTRLKGRSRARRTMWSRRAQEYEAKINSGDPSSIAEVVRDLYRNAGQPDQSYSERQIYQAALDRLAREFAVIEKIDETTAAERLEQMLRAA
jgi:CarD family transcriptional regulator